MCYGSMQSFKGLRCVNSWKVHGIGTSQLRTFEEGSVAGSRVSWVIIDREL